MCHFLDGDSLFSLSGQDSPVIIVSFGSKSLIFITHMAWSMAWYIYPTIWVMGAKKNIWQIYTWSIWAKANAQVLCKALSQPGFATPATFRELRCQKQITDVVPKTKCILPKMIRQFQHIGLVCVGESTDIYRYIYRKRLSFEWNSGFPT